MNLDQLREFVVRPTLDELRLWTPSAENLVVGTGLVESMGYEFLHQVGGPAIGFWQMEPFTYDDIWKTSIGKLLPLRYDGKPSAEQMHWDLRLAAAMCRMLYYRIPEALPEAKDALGMARYWKKYYNTELGKGTVDKALKSFEVACA